MASNRSFDIKQRNNSGIPVQDPDIMLRKVTFQELEKVANAYSLYFALETNVLCNTEARK
jgi:hypothetical protein